MPKKSIEISENTIPAIATHPGEVLADELASRKMNKSEFAKRLNVSVLKFNSLLQGKQNISPEVAVMLESLLGIQADFWIRLQLNYEKDSLLIKYRDIFEKSKVAPSIKKKFITCLTSIL